MPHVGFQVFCRGSSLPFPKGMILKVAISLSGPVARSPWLAPTNGKARAKD